METGIGNFRKMNALINKVAALEAAANARWGEEGAALRQINEKLAALENMEAAMRSDEAAAASAIEHLQKLEWLRFWIQLGMQVAGSAYTPLLAAFLLWAASRKEGWGWKITCGLCAYFLSPTAATLLCAGSGLWGFLKWLRSSPTLPADPTPATANSASQQESWAYWAVAGLSRAARNYFAPSAATEAEENRRAAQQERTSPV
jgi:hypothetical protein